MPLFLPQFDLQKYNTLASPVTADFFVSVKNENELKAALSFASERKVPFFVLGGGSNIVLHSDFHGLVIHLQILGKECVREDAEFYYVKAAAGENWHEFVSYCLESQYWGLENLSLIPGTVGAAPIQNIGAYGVELKDVFSELTALDISSGLKVTFTLDACQFDYRDSVFKQALKDQFIILSVTFKLLKKPALTIHYPALKEALTAYSIEDLTPDIVSQCVCDIRRSKLPDPLETPNVGSFFKNPIVDESLLLQLQTRFPDIIFYPQGAGKVKLAAAWLIDRAGWKGFSGVAAVHRQQALVLTNPNRLMANHLLDLAAQIQASILKKFSVELEQEPRSYP